MKIGLIREGKNPPDKRVALTPQQCTLVPELFPGTEIFIQSSNVRSYSDDEYKAFGLQVVDDVSHCDILIGIKEVPKTELIDSKTYLFFSHTIKKQPHNKELLQTIVKKNCSLIDYECLTDEEHNRIIGFGRYAGIVGSYNGLIGYGKKYDLFALKPAHLCRDHEEMLEEMKRVKLSNIKIVVTGGGRVANGAMETLGALKIRRVTPYELLHYSYREPVYAQLHSQDYHEAKDGSLWSTPDFYAHPERYRSTFSKYTKECDLLIHCSFWDPKSPQLFTKEQMKDPQFRISVIADLSCDIDGGAPSTIRASSIDKPFYGYNPATQQEDIPFGKQSVTVMAVDNLPCELPRDASEDFGKSLLDRVFPSLLVKDEHGTIERATIAKEGKLTADFQYLSDYLA